jgi:hypothetical protein
MRSLASLSLLLGICFCQPAHCSSLLPAAHVLAFGNYGDGSVWITLDRPHDQPGCPGSCIELPPDGPANKSVLASAALALATGASVLVHVDGCIGLAGTFTGGRSGTAFGVNKP